MSNPQKQTVLLPEITCRLAAIDIGSNSIRLVVAEPLRGSSYRILDEEKVTSRLAHGLSKTGSLDAKTMDATLVALRRMKQIADGYQVAQLKTIATCAVREAKNGGELVRRAAEEFGLAIEVITAEQEARLAFCSVQRSFDLSDKPVAVVDIGGGSTEIVLAMGNLVEAIYTTQLGAVRLSEMYGAASAMAGVQFEKLQSSIDRQLRKQFKSPVFVPHLLYGSGGTFTSLASILIARKGQAGLPVRGCQVTRAEVKHLVERLRKMTPKERAAMPGLAADRADIIVPGLAIIDRVMHRLGVNVLQVHNRGVRDGLLLTMIDDMQISHTSARDREAAVERLAASCGTELAHGRHVARLAREIFEQLAQPYKLEADDRPLLEAAARLQDVGYLINYDQHHKHSYHLILNSRLEGFQPRELELIANIARYHRGSPPKAKHPNYGQLAPRDQQRVSQLAAILRIAAGLDRSHTQQVERVQIRPEGAQTEVQVVAPEQPEVDLWGARQRRELFEKVFKTSLRLQWVRPEPAAVEHVNGKPNAPADSKAGHSKGARTSAKSG